MRMSRLVTLLASVALVACGGTASTKTSNSGASGSSSTGSLATAGNTSGNNTNGTGTGSGTTTSGSSGTNSGNGSGSTGNTTSGTTGNTTSGTTGNTTSGTTGNTTSGNTSGTTGALTCTPGVEGLGVPLASAGSALTSLVLGDVNNDGILDLLAADGSNGFSVMLGYGDGTFANRASFTVSASNAQAIALGEFSGDGKVDVAVGDSYYYDGTITVLKGAGSGAFTSYLTLNPYSDLGTGDYFGPGALATADLDGDGRTDLIAANNQYQQLAVYPGQDGGGFAAPHAYGGASGYGVAAITVADFTGDNKPDVAAALNGSGGVKLFINSGGALAEQSGSLTAVNSPTSVVAADLNHDNNVDLVVGGAGGVAVLMNQGNAAFGTASTLTTPFDVKSVAVGDLDHDGKLDIVAGASTQRLVEVFYGDGAGGFPRTLLFDGPYVTQLASADLNGDQHADVVAGGYDGSVSVMMANPTGTLLSGQFLAGATATASASSPVAVDLNGDGSPDLLALNRADQTFTVYLSTAPGVYDVPVPYALQAGARADGLVAGDFTGDGKVDVVIADEGNGEVEMLPGQTGGTFGLPKYTPVTVNELGYFQAVAAADFDHDGKLDVVATDESNGKVWFLSNHASTTSQFATPVAVNLPSGARPFAVVAGRFSSGPGPDLAVLDGSTAQVFTLINAGDGGFPTSAVTSLASTGTQLAVVDADGHGQDDLVVTEQSGVEILTGTVGGTFNAASTGAANFAGGANLADLTGDGIPDLVAVGNDLVSVYPGLPGGGFGTALTYPAPSLGQPLLVDLNGDGRLDLVAPTVPGLSYWLSSCWH